MSRTDHKIDLRLQPGVHDAFVRDLRSNLSRDRGDPRADYLADVLLSKYVGPDTAPAPQRRARAIEKWLGTESRNARTNQRLYGLSVNYRAGTTFHFGDRSVDSDELIEWARRYIRRLIGTEPHLERFRFTGGASTAHRRQPGMVPLKYQGNLDVTPEAWPWVLPILQMQEAWWRLNPKVLEPRYVEGNVLFTVPKTTEIDRVACKEPDLNLFAQTAVGLEIRRSLLRAGINLNDQSINRRLAREGSISGELSTLDLSSASDSVTTTLVARLLPPGWFTLMDNLRCRKTTIAGPEGKTVHENEMFSSMGNGFTFELESLLFYALARAVAYFSGTSGVISVYGDDIIVPRRCARHLVAVLGFCGFKVNTEKSCIDGDFRESCGGHYYRGSDVTPFYLKEPINDQERLIHALNRLRRWAGLAFKDVLDPGYASLWRKYAKLVDRRLWGGTNPDDPTRLVSPPHPKGGWRLVRERARKKEKQLLSEFQLGFYLQTLNETSQREGPVSPQDARKSVVVETKAWRLGKVADDGIVNDQPAWFTPHGWL